MSRSQALLLSAIACALALAGCSDDGPLGDGSDASTNAADADPNAPDADPNAPGAADARPGSPDAAMAQGCTATALELITLVNQYRAENSLPAIAASTSLCMVGDSHVNDLIDNSPDALAECNLHSWSDQGSWSACCYTSDHARASCMWDKPRELTAYTGNGYENAARRGGSITPAQALGQWKSSAGHNAVILNEGIWADNNWQALGVGIRGGTAVLWFGTAVDPAN